MAKGTRYPAESKAEAVRLYRASARPQREVASELGIAPETLRRWVIRQDIDGASRAGLTTEEREELRVYLPQSSTRSERPRRVAARRNHATSRWRCLFEDPKVLGDGGRAC